MKQYPMILQVYQTNFNETCKTFFSSNQINLLAVRQQEINYLAEFLKHLDDINEKIENEGSP